MCGGDVLVTGQFDGRLPARYCALLQRAHQKSLSRFS